MAAPLRPAAEAGRHRGLQGQGGHAGSLPVPYASVPSTTVHELLNLLGGTNTGGGLQPGQDVQRGLRSGARRGTLGLLRVP